MFKGHPKGLPVLFFTEMWERFGFYLMLGIFSLYMLDPSEPGPFGGMGFSREWAAEVYGTYLALVYLTPFFGGIIADRFLGYRKSVYLGGTLMALGYLGLAVPGVGIFYISLLLIVLGNGFFKPNISTLVGRLYPEGSKLKDSGYNIFYMGINIGAFVCNFVAAILRNNFGWGYAFAAAGIGMLIGLVTFFLGQKHLTMVHDRGEVGSVADTGILGKLVFQIIIPAGICGFIGYEFFGGLFGGSPQTAAFIFATIPVIGYYVVLVLTSPKEERAPIGALLSIFAVVIVFWMIFHQNGSSLTYWAEENTKREAGVLAPVLRFFSFDQDATIGTTIKDPDAPGSYWRNVPPEQRPPAGKTVTLISTELFQSINPFFVVFLTPLVVGFFGWLRRRNKEPSTPAKIAWGMVITAVSTLFMIAAVHVTHGGQFKASPWWLVGTYGVITVGELFLSPMGLALVSKLSPKRVTALMMGGWFLATAIGNKLSGVLAGLWEKIPLEGIFWINFASALGAALVIAALTPWIRRVMAEHEQATADRIAAEAEATASAEASSSE
ncbi:MAG: MFS transporter [Calditrichaeota bacterium]|nr:MAG: MFS transporter [Calditrichota bacterium]